MTSENSKCPGLKIKVNAWLGYNTVFQRMYMCNSEKQKNIKNKLLGHMLPKVNSLK